MAVPILCLLFGFIGQVPPGYKDKIPSIMGG